jgi:uncharacterized repeat protein (TIGR03803 family)
LPYFAGRGGPQVAEALEQISVRQEFPGMERESTLSIVKLAFASALTLVLVALPQANAQTFAVIHSFAGTDGSGPLSGLVIAKNGTLYGTTSSGGAYGHGAAFKSTQNGAETVLHSFGSGSDGATPEGQLVIDASGNFYGTTFAGGTYGVGTVFKMAPAGMEKLLYTFPGGINGSSPVAGLAVDILGNLYGTTTAGGAYNNGTVFKVTSTGQHTVLYSFQNGTDGSDPVGGVTLDALGNLYGTTAAGGTNGYGTVFELTPSGSTWTESILHNFEMQADGGTPYAGLILDSAGNLYGAATQGGLGSNAGGSLFELSPSAGAWTFDVMYDIPGWGISGAFRNLMFEAANGVIYGTTHCDGNFSAGTVYQLTNSAGTWTYTLLYTFTGGNDGLYSFSNLVMDKTGHLYGTTNQGGANGQGVIFKIKP